MGSEMCIRDRDCFLQVNEVPAQAVDAQGGREGALIAAGEQLDHCLLYTSDAADERSSVDLGGRRIIKKKNRANTNSRRGRHIVRTTIKTLTSSVRRG